MLKSHRKPGAVMQATGDRDLCDLRPSNQATVQLKQSTRQWPERKGRGDNDGDDNKSMVLEAGEGDTFRGR